MGQQKINLLLTGAGTQTFVNVIDALTKTKKFKLNIIGCDIDPLAHGLYLCNKGIIIPRANNPEYINVLVDICRKKKIDILVPLLSLEYPKISKAKKKFEEIGTIVPISDYSTIRITMDKKLTFDFFAKNSISTPKTFLPEEIPSSPTYPLIIKPRRSSGTKNVYKLENPKDLARYLKIVPDPIIQEFLEGEEYTIDTLSYWDSTPITIIPRVRLRVMDGKSVRGKTIHNAELISQVREIIKKLNLIGPANIQCFKIDNKFMFTEINPRFSAGGLPLAVEAGVNTPELLIRMAKNEVLKEHMNYKKNLFMLRYFTEIFINEKEIIK